MSRKSVNYNLFGFDDNQHVTFEIVMVLFI